MYDGSKIVQLEHINNHPARLLIFGNNGLEEKQCCSVQEPFRYFRYVLRLSRASDECQYWGCAIWSNGHHNCTIDQWLGLGPDVNT